MTEKSEALASVSQASIDESVRNLFKASDVDKNADNKSKELRISEALAVLEFARGSEGWKIVEAEVSRRYEYLNAKLMSVPSMDEITKIRGEIVGIETVKMIIQQLIQAGRTAAVQQHQEESMEGEGL